MVTEAALTLGGEHTMQYTDDIFILELYTWNVYNFINQCQLNEFNKILNLIKYIKEIFNVMNIV